MPFVCCRQTLPDWKFMTDHVREVHFDEDVEPLRCPIEYCMIQFRRFGPFSQHVRTVHRDFYLANRISNQGRSVSSFNEEEMDCVFDVPEMEPEDTFNSYSGQSFEDDLESNGSDVDSDADLFDINQTLSHVDTCNQSMIFDSKIDALKDSTARLAFAIKSRNLVASKVADRIAKEWFNHILQNLQELFDIPPRQMDKLHEVACVASNHESQQKRVRLQIVPRPVFLPQSSKSYQYISIIDQLRELVKIPEVQKAIDDDYYGIIDFF